ncbi:hypothetical protein UY3_12811 [Chelonia mydas]|uniref:Uncharacterized protein n=1 Tax=Chelonia mydas TaxID=8469 RepID=M7B3N8_CHEMY|nr:hypothetical protein UY3_12811 [Chelonia mydas]
MTVSLSRYCSIDGKPEKESYASALLPVPEPGVELYQPLTVEEYLELLPDEYPEELLELSPGKHPEELLELLAAEYLEDSAGA